MSASASDTTLPVELSGERQEAVLAKTAALRSLPRNHVTIPLFRSLPCHGDVMGEDVAGYMSGDTKSNMVAAIGMLRGLSATESNAMAHKLSKRELHDELCEALYECGLAEDPNGTLYVSPADDDGNRRKSEWGTQSVGPIVCSVIAYVEEVYDISLPHTWLANGDVCREMTYSGKPYPDPDIPEKLRAIGEDSDE